MIEQLQTIRAGLETATCYSMLGVDAHSVQIALTALAQLEAMVGEPARPDIIEKLTCHARERDDMTLDDCLCYLNTKGWHKVRGRTERELILQITELLAAAPVAQQYEAGDMASAAAQGFRDGVASVAQQPQAEPDESIAADAYGLACDEMERWQHERRKAGKEVGTTGSLCDGIAWLYGYIDDLEAKQPQAEAVRSKPVRVCHIRDAACSEFAAKCGECPEASSEWWKHEQAQTLHLSSDEAPQQAEAAASNEYQRNILTSVSNWMRTRSHTAWAEKFGYSSLMRTWADDLQAVAAPQQAEAVTDVVRDAAPIPDHELVTMYDERPTSDLEMIEFAREVERRHGIGVQPQHITDGSPCWCNPDVAYTDPETGASVIVHRRPQ